MEDKNIPAQGGPITLTPEQIATIVQQSLEILQNTPGPEQVKPKQGRPKKKPEDKLRGYRFNLTIDKDLEKYMKETAWRKKTSITQYVNDLIRADMESYFKDCEEKGIDPKEGWEVYEP